MPVSTNQVRVTLPPVLKMPLIMGGLSNRTKLPTIRKLPKSSGLKLELSTRQVPLLLPTVAGAP